MPDRAAHRATLGVVIAPGGTVASMGNLPNYDELPRRAGYQASWVVWGPEGTDHFGCLNLLTAERAVEAAGLVRRGAAFPMNWDASLPTPPLFGRSSFTHEVTGDARSRGHDDVLHGWNTQSSSQWDGFRHIRNLDALEAGLGTGHYGGVPDEDHGMHHWAQRGLVGRAVLADIGRWRTSIGRPLHCGESDVIEPEEIGACLAAQGTTLREGDVLLIRTGWISWYLEQPASVREHISDRSRMTAVGLRGSERTAEVLWNLHIAAIGMDNPAIEVWPPPSAEHPQDDRSRMFIHFLLLPMLGLPLGELWNLDPLATDCAADGRYEGMFTSAPLNMPAGVASPPNAIVIK